MRVREREAQRGSSPEDASVSGFPALAEAHRRAGHAGEAEEIARAGLRRRPELVAGRVALALALLDLGRTDDARAELESALEAVPDHARAVRSLEDAREREARATPRGRSETLLDRIDDGEIERAFERAQVRPEEMLDATSVARSAMAADGLDGPEESFQPDSPFATRTVAELLERQGRGEDARQLRETLERKSRSRGDAPVASERGKPRLIAKLERWLENARRGHA